MTIPTGRALLMVTFFVSIAIISWQERNNKTWWGFTHPKRYVGACVAYGMLGIAEPFISSQLAGMLGAGLAIGITMRGKMGDMPTDRLGGSGEVPPQSKPRGTNAGLTNLGATIRAAVREGTR